MRDKHLKSLISVRKNIPLFLFANHEETCCTEVIFSNLVNELEG